MSKTNQVQEMAYLVCEMANKPESCKECKGRGGCFTLPKMRKLVDAGYIKKETAISELSKVFAPSPSESYIVGKCIEQIRNI